MSRWRQWAFPIGVFLVGRGGLFILAYLGLAMLPLPRHSPNYWRAFPDNLVLDGWARWDSAWYQGIADNGYRNVPDDVGMVDTRFFPFYPWLMRAMRLFTGNTMLAGMVISNLAFLLALLGLYAMVKERCGEQVARRSLILLSVYPFSFFFSAVYTESVCLAAGVGAFYFGGQRRWVLAAACASMAAATRIPGCLVAVGLVVLYLEQISFDPRKIRPDILLLGLALVLPALHFYQMWSRFDDPFVFLHSHLRLKGARSR